MTLEEQLAQNDVLIRPVSIVHMDKMRRGKKWLVAGRAI